MRSMFVFLFAVSTFSTQANADDLKTWMNETVAVTRGDAVAACLEKKLSDSYYSSSPYLGFIVLHVIPDSKNGLFRVDVVGDATTEAAAFDAMQRIRVMYDLIGKNCAGEPHDTIRARTSIGYRSMKTGQKLKSFATLELVTLPKPKSP